MPPRSRRVGTAIAVPVRIAATPKPHGASGDRADDADNHTFRESEAEKGRRTPASGREHRLLTSAITEVHRQHIGDAERSEEQCQHGSDQVDTAHLHADDVTHCGADDLPLKGELDRQ